MKTVINKTNAPLKVSLPRGKALHLGPKKSGEIRDEHADHAAVKKLVDAGSIEIFDGNKGAASQAGGGASPHVSTQGPAKSRVTQKSGDR